MPEMIIVQQPIVEANAHVTVWITAACVSLHTNRGGISRNKLGFGEQLVSLAVNITCMVQGLQQAPQACYWLQAAIHEMGDVQAKRVDTCKSKNRCH